MFPLRDCRKNHILMFSSRQIRSIKAFFGCMILLVILEDASSKDVFPHNERNRLVKYKNELKKFQKSGKPGNVPCCCSANVVGMS